MGFAPGYDAYAVFDCTSARVGGSVTLTVSAPTSGWQYRIIEARTQPSLWRTAAFEASLNNFATFQIDLGPQTQDVSGCGRLTVTSSAPNGATSSATLEACVAQPIQPVTASLVGGILPPISFSFEQRIVSGSLKVRVENPSGVTGWMLDISATNLAYTGPAPGQANLPASNLRVVRPGMASLPLSNTPQRIVTNGGSGLVYEYPLELLIPGGAAAGTYTGTVTVSTISAPGK